MRYLSLKQNKVDLSIRSFGVATLIFSLAMILFPLSVVIVGVVVCSSQLSFPSQLTSVTTTTRGGRSLMKMKTLQQRLEEDPFIPPQLQNYHPAPVEKYMLNNMDLLNYNTYGDDLAEGCLVWRQEELKVDKNWTKSQVYEPLHAFRRELKHYYQAISNYSYMKDHNIADVRRHLTLSSSSSSSHQSTNHDICQQMRLPRQTLPAQQQQQQQQQQQRLRRNQAGSGPPDNLSLQQAYFPSGQLSYNQDTFGYMEPLVTPLRHPDFCFHRQGDPETFDAYTLTYLVHDFEAMCQALTTRSRIVFLDLGAAPEFWEVEHAAFKLVRLYEKFGFKFDHIYAMERPDNDAKEAPPGMSMETVHKRVPSDLHGSYHWIHSGIHTEPGHRFNPWTWIEQEFTEQDLILVKMDIGPSNIEHELVQQLLASPKLLNLVDHFYYEHKVHLKESSRAWGGQMIGSIADSIALFAQLREAGVASHYWV